VRLTHYLLRATTLPPHETLRSARALWLRTSSVRRERATDRRRPTYALGVLDDALRLTFRLGPLPESLLRDGAEARARRAALALEHRFDLLGSGPCRVTYGAACAGLEGIRFPPRPSPTVDRDGRWLAREVPPADVAEAQRIWRLVEPGYTPIDWQIDFKSGFRWDARAWWRDISYGELRGVDVKVPWELGRLQHLPLLALAYASAGPDAVGLGDADSYLREFRNQTLDFLAANPPRYGVQWACPMDVGIRAANLALAWDWFRAHGAAFDAEFEQLVARALYEHGRFLIRHIEWMPNVRSNHFLCGIAGLAFCAAYLPQGAETDSWLAYAAGALAAEVPRQFHPDGGNYEDSTAYHRLSGEAVTYAAAALAGLRDRVAAVLARPQTLLGDTPGWDGYATSRNIFTPELATRFAAIARFTRGVTRPDGLVPDIGDNDSGRFVKLEDGAALQDHRHLVDAVEALFEGPARGIDGCTVRGLAGGAPFGPLPAYPPGQQPRRFPQFGLCVYETGRLWLAVRCGALAGGGAGSHVHNDQLSFELTLDGVPFFVDCGAWLYTPLPEARTRFRGAAMHNTLAVEGREQFQPGSASLFHVLDTALPRIVEASESLFVGEHGGFGAPCRRTFRVAPNGIEVAEFCAAQGAKSVNLHLHPGVHVERSDGAVILAHGAARLSVAAEDGSWRVADSQLASGYGRLVATRKLVLPVAGDTVTWRIGFDP
jgi:Heparinase II/III-like protein/Heparinase II/III N-terminus